jgi:hypothetical protein
MDQVEINCTGSMPSWSQFKLLSFRFCFVYLGMYVAVTQMLPTLFVIPDIDVPEIGSLWPLRAITSWTARHIFHHQAELVISGSGSGDKTFDWVQAFCLLVIAFLVTMLWSGLDRPRTHYCSLHKWFHLTLRFAVGSTMLTYGFDKAIPLQMPYPYLFRLLEPVGNFSPMGMLWTSVGASPGYEIFAGCAEIMGGLLILVPRTAMLGALVCLADMTQVFMLNMTYDVPVKLFSFHMILLCIFLLGPHAARLGDFFFRDSAVPAPKAVPLFRSLRANRFALSAQFVFLGYLVLVDIYGARKGWQEYGGGAPKSALYGIWNVEEFSVDGQIRAPLLSDTSRWRRMIFQIPESVNCQMMDDTFHRYVVTLDAKASSLALAEANAKEPKGKFRFQRPLPDQLLLDGLMDGHSAHVRLQIMDREKLLLVSRGFHWIQEYPFNR